MNQRRQYCSLRVGDLLLGIDVSRIQEVLRDTSITPVPLAHPAIRGLINLRGQIVTAIDLRRRLGLAPSAAGSRFSTMVLGETGEALALVVDSVGDVVHVDSASFESPPDTLKGEARRMIDGAHKLERELLLILNLDVVTDLGRGSE
ncbi:MAG: chemotaxis protein CheW [Thermoanaerobaculales bacterium]|jgi:purine-binding chemotaxis protein CheW|nr:chemotaxis protein CheW [Thermoanaerobaculales bacterium]